MTVSEKQSGKLKSTEQTSGKHTNKNTNMIKEAHALVGPNPKHPKISKENHTPHQKISKAIHLQKEMHLLEVH